MVQQPMQMYNQQQNQERQYKIIRNILNISTIRSGPKPRRRGQRKRDG
jgi:hypothetical protein